MACAIVAMPSVVASQGAPPVGVIPCPSQLPVPAGTASQAPIATAAPRPSTSRPSLRASPAAIQLNAGTCARIVVERALAPFTVSSATGVVSATPQPDGSILVYGTTNGVDTLSVVDARGARATVAVLVASDAGALPPSVTVRLAGSGLSQQYVYSIVTLELARAAHVQPGASVTPIDSQLLPALAPGSPGWTTTIPVSLSGHGLWRDVKGNVAVQVTVNPLTPLEPSLLFASDDPETIVGTSDGVVFHAKLSSPGSAARLFAYHELDHDSRQLSLVVTSSGTSHVQVVGDSAGPGPTSYAGHTMSVRFLQVHREQRSFVATIDQTPLVLGIGGISKRQQLVTGIYDLGLIDGSPVDVYVVVGEASASPNVDSVVPQVVLDKDGHSRSGVYPLDAIPPIVLSASITRDFRVPHQTGTFTTLGAWALPPIVGVRNLGGDYGIVRSVRLTMTNATDLPGTVYLYVAPSAPGATTSILFDQDGLDADGTPKVTSLACLQGLRDVIPSSERYLLRAFTVEPTQGGLPLVVTGDYMTDGGSTYPMEMGLTLEPPLAPRPMCTPAPAATPVGSPSPTPSSGSRSSRF